MVQTNSQFSKCFIALGGNQKTTLHTIIKAILTIAALKNVVNVVSSRLFLTSPVSPIPQPHFLNACLSLSTTLNPVTLFSQLEMIEINLGKIKKPKEETRLIDIDLLMHGNENMNTPHLTLPHPRMHERLFVLLPLNDLMNVNQLAHFNNVNNEIVTPLSHTLPFQVHP